MTDKLYYTDGETRTFTAQVLSCTEENGACSVALDRTALFPGGGGQDADTGTLAGQPIIGMREADETVYHIVPEPLEPGTTVSGEVDWALRFRACRGTAASTSSPASCTGSSEERTSASTWARTP